MDNNVKPSIYIACLAAYNNGYLHGKWIDASQSADDIYSEIQTVLSDSPIEEAEEFAIHDYEGFGSIKIEEYDSIDTIVEYASFIEQHGDLSELLAEYDVSKAIEMIEENYHGLHDSESDFAYQLIQDCYGDEALPDNLMNYFDYDAFARDLFICDYFSIDSNNGVHVFTNN